MVVLVEFPAWAIAIVCLGLALILTEFVIALLGWLIDLLNLIPKVNLGTDFLQTVEQSVSNAFGVAFGWVDHELGASIHALARFGDWLWREVEEAASGYALLAELVAKIAYAHSGLKSLVHRLTATHTVTSARVKTLEREYHGIEEKVKTLEHDYAHGIGDDVLPRIRTLEREAAHIENVELPTAEAAQQQSESAISNLYEWAKGKASLLGVGTFTLAVATALDALGLGGLRCPSFLRSLNSRGCGLFNGLEDMLGLFVDLFIITDLCEVIPLLETAYADVAAPAVGLLTEAIDAMPCVAGNQAPALTVPRLYLPASPSLALALP